MRKYALLAFCLAALAVLPGCTFLLASSLGAALYYSQPEEVEVSFPTVFISPITVTVSGDVDVEHTVSDVQGDFVDIQVFYSIDGTIYSYATPVAGTYTVGLPSSAGGVTHHFIWDSLTDVGTAPLSTVYIKIIPNDHTGVGPEKVHGPFSVDNNGIPVVTNVTPGAPFVEDITVTYTVTDAEDNTVDVVVEWREGGSGSFTICTEGTGGDGTTGLSASSTGDVHTYMWDSEADTTCRDVTGVEIRITPSDTKQGSSGTSAPILVANNDPPAIVSITLPSTDVTGTATIEYVMSDSHSDTSQMELQFKRESDGTDWTSFGQIATPDASDPTYVTHNRATSVTGVDHVFPWDSDAAADMLGEDAQVRVRIRATDDGGTIWGAWTESATAFWIRNDTPPRIELGATTAHDSGIVYLPYNCIDAESNDVSLLVEYRPFGAPVWRRATAGPGTTPITFTASPSGTGGVFAWDSKRDGVVSQSVSIRVTPSETTVVGLPAYTSLTIANDNTEHHAAKTSLPQYQIYATGATLRNRIVIAGGYGGATAGRTVYAYDPAANAWTRRADMGTTRANTACTVVNGILYVVGGEYGSSTYASMEAYDWDTNAWSSRASMSTPRGELGAASSGGLIYAMGGEASSSGTAMNSMEIYDPATDAWSPGPPMPAARKGLSCTSTNGKIYAAGGSSTSFYIFDPTTGGWTVGPNMIHSRNAFGLVSVEGRVYALAGWEGGIIDAVDEYDPERNTWYARTPLNMARYNVAAASLNGKIYVMSGWNGGNIPDVEAYIPLSHTWTTMAGQPVPRTRLGVAGMMGQLHTAGGTGVSTVREAYNPAGNVWTTPLALPQGRENPGVVVLDGRLYVVGGYNGSAPTNTVQIYNSSTNLWSTGAPMPTSRECVSCAAWGGRIYAIGGAVRGSPWVKQAVVEIYDPVANGWTTGAPMITPRWECGVAVIEDRIYTVSGWQNDGGFARYQNAVEAYDPVANTWVSRAVFPAQRKLLGCVALEGRIYTMGGTGQAGNVSNAEIYDPRSNTWSQGAPLPTTGMTWAGSVGTWGFTAGLSNNFALRTSRGGFIHSRQPLSASVSGARMVNLGSEIFSIGGGNFATLAVASVYGTPLMETLPADTSQPFDLTRNWTAKADLPVALRDFACTVFNNKVYVAGGVDDTGMVRNETYEYDPASDTWAALTSMTTARFAMGSARVNNRFFVIGGDLGGGTKTVVVEEFDLNTLTWATPAAMPTARSHFGCTVEENRVFAVGGEGTGGTYVTAVEMFDPPNNAWTSYNPLSVGVKGPTCLSERGRLTLLGGEVFIGGAARISDRILLYEAESDRWVQGQATLPYPARDLAGVAGIHTWSHRGSSQDDNFCFLAGGFDGTVHRDGFFRFYTR